MPDQRAGRHLMASAANLQDSVAAEIRRYGSLEDAIAGLIHDSGDAPMDARVHEVLREALAYQSAVRAAPIWRAA